MTNPGPSILDSIRSSAMSLLWMISNALIRHESVASLPLSCCQCVSMRSPGGRSLERRISEADRTDCLSFFIILEDEDSRRREGGGSDIRFLAGSSLGREGEFPVEATDVASMMFNSGALKPNISPRSRQDGPRPLLTTSISLSVTNSAENKHTVR